VILVAMESGLANLTDTHVNLRALIHDSWFWILD